MASGKAQPAGEKSAERMVLKGQGASPISVCPSLHKKRHFVEIPVLANLINIETNDYFCLKVLQPQFMCSKK